MGFSTKDFLYDDIASMRRTIRILQKGIVLKSREYLKNYHGIKVDIEGLKKIEADYLQHTINMVEDYKKQDEFTYIDESELLTRVFIELAFDRLVDKKPLSKQPFCLEIV